MFSSIKSKLLLAVYLFLILSIPVGAYLASQHQTLSSSAKQPQSDTAKATPQPSNSAAKQLLKQSEKLATKSAISPLDNLTVPTSVGPTLSLKAFLEGRPQNNQITSLFVGIAEGSISLNPKFLLSFTIDLPSSGEYDNLSLAGLTAGSTYTALLKASSSIATSSAFLMSPVVSKLNDGNAITLLIGDLNDDNVINSADYSIAKGAFGATDKSGNWNDNIDFNKDGLINALDLGFIIKNFGKAGESGGWVSPVPKTASSSGSLIPATGGTGYWLWIPQ